MYWNTFLIEPISTFRFNSISLYRLDLCARTSKHHMSRNTWSRAISLFLVFPRICYLRSRLPYLLSKKNRTAFVYCMKYAASSIKYIYSHLYASLLYLSSEPHLFDFFYFRSFLTRFSLTVTLFENLFMFRLVWQQQCELQTPQWTIPALLFSSLLTEIEQTHSYRPKRFLYFSLAFIATWISKTVSLTNTLNRFSFQPRKSSQSA